MLVTLELIIERALDRRYSINVRYFFPSLSFSFSSFSPPPSPPFIRSCTHNCLKSQRGDDESHASCQRDIIASFPPCYIIAYVVRTPPFFFAAFLVSGRPSLVVLSQVGGVGKVGEGRGGKRRCYERDVGS